MTWLAKLSKMSTNIAALSGIVMSNNYCMFIYFQHNFFWTESLFHSCLGHIVNLGNIDVMACIMKITAVKNTTAIWEYDPTWDDNHVLGGSLDIIVAICILALKVSISWSSKFTSHIVKVQSSPMARLEPEPQGPVQVWTEFTVFMDRTMASLTEIEIEMEKDGEVVSRMIDGMGNTSMKNLTIQMIVIWTRNSGWMQVHASVCGLLDLTGTAFVIRETGGGQFFQAELKSQWQSVNLW